MGVLDANLSYLRWAVTHHPDGFIRKAAEATLLFMREED